MEKIRRNSPCPCGSGRKFKKCCGHPVTGIDVLRQSSVRRATDARRMLDAHQARELIRQSQQGQGKPIISGTLAGHRFVAVANTIYHSPKWKVFPDFLSDYLKGLMESSWGNAELAKPIEQQHPLMHWYRAYCSWQASTTDAKSDAIKTAPATGAAWCYIGLAYNLYLLKHNVEIQARLLKRLRDPDPRHFQGAYYELIVAGILIRAGFKLALEDEQDGESGHCEFSAVAPSGKKYWVEAKMRSVVGVFGVTKALGGSTSRDPTEKVTAHLRQAFQKPAPGERLVFIDVNAPNEATTPPAWCERVSEKLTKSEKDRDGAQRAYVFVSNMNFHHHLSDEGVGGMVMAYGYGIDDFAKEGHFTFSEQHRNQMRHQDASAILKSFQTYTTLPSTFDGSLISDRDAPEARPIIGETYYFGEAGNEILAEVTSALISEDKEMVLAVRAADDKAWIVKGPATDQQLADFKEHGEAYFGRPRRTKSKLDDPYELFLWLLDNCKNLSQEELMRQVADAPDIAQLGALSRDDLAIELAERQANAFMAATGGERPTPTVTPTPDQAAAS